MTYRKLFLSERNYAVLVIVQFISYFGAWFSQVGVYTMLLDFNYAPFYEQAASVKNWAITLGSVFAFLPPILLAPISGVIIDSIPPKRLLIAAVALEMASVLGLLFIRDASLLGWLFALIFLRLAVASLYFQTQMSLLPSMFSPRRLKLANELFSVVWAVSYTAGMACAGVFIEHFGVRAAFLLDGALFAAALALLCTLRLNVVQKTAKLREAFSAAKEGLGYLLKTPKLQHLIILHALVGITAYDALINFLAGFNYAGKVSFGSALLGSSMLIGLSNSVRACSLVIGPVVLSRLVNDRRIAWFFIAQGAGICLWAALQFNFYLSFIGLIAAGFFTSTIWSYTYTAIQRACDERYYGRVIAYVDAVYMSASLGVTLFIGAAFSWGASAQLISVLMGSVFFAGALHYVYFLRRFNEKTNPNRR